MFQVYARLYPQSIPRVINKNDLFCGFRLRAIIQMMVNNEKLWSDVLVDLELELSKANFSTWFRNTCVLKEEDDVVYLGVPNAFVKEWLSTKYHKTILKSLRENRQSVRAVEYIISKAAPREFAGAEAPSEAPVTQANQLRLEELYIDKEDNLNPRYTFDSFVVGSFNELAYAASQAVIKNPGMSYNPLFVYGGTGLGKTHLIQSVGNHVKRGGGKKVFYTTSEKFSQDLVNALRNNKTHLFKNRYREYDVFIMDDVQFMSGKEKMQEELFHLFNSLYDSNKQIVFSSDKPPKYIPELEGRLRSRFEGGMIVDVSQPDYESRLAILKNKLRSSGGELADEVLDYIASTVQDNVRELEGALNVVVCQAQLKRRSLAIGEVRTIIKNNIKPRKNISTNDVIKTVAGFYNINEPDLYEKTRRKEVVKPRQVAMYILREDFSASYPHIGQRLGGRDHTTVIHAYEKIKRDLEVNELLRQEIEQIKQIIHNSLSLS